MWGWGYNKPIATSVTSGISTEYGLLGQSGKLEATVEPIQITLPNHSGAPIGVRASDSISLVLTTTGVLSCGVDGTHLGRFGPHHQLLPMVVPEGEQVVNAVCGAAHVIVVTGSFRSSRLQRAVTCYSLAV